MDIIKAIEDFTYYHNATAHSREEWEKWRIKAAEEWKLDVSLIVGKERENGRGKEISKRG